MDMGISRCIASTTTGGGSCCCRLSILQMIVNAKAATPFAQRNFLNTVRVMFQWAKREGRIPDDPSAGVTREKVKTTGYRTWSEAEIQRFEAAHAIGTKARLAFALLLYTGQRRGDVVKLGRQNGLKYNLCRQE
jgi:integrase